MRDMQKLIDEYREMFPCNENKGPKIGLSEIRALYRMSNDSYQMIDNSLLAGIMIGYKYAKNSKPKKRA